MGHILDMEITLFSSLFYSVSLIYYLFCSCIGNPFLDQIPLFALLNSIQKNKHSPESLQIRNRNTGRYRQTINEGDKDRTAAIGQPSKVYVTCLQRIVTRAF